MPRLAPVTITVPCLFAGQSWSSHRPPVVHIASQASRPIHSARGVRCGVPQVLGLPVPLSGQLEDLDGPAVRGVVAVGHRSILAFPTLRAAARSRLWCAGSAPQVIDVLAARQALEAGSDEDRQTR